MRNSFIHMIRLSLSSVSIILIICLLSFNLIAQTPTINSISPQQGYPGQIISINGYDFESGAIVSFGAVHANVTFSSDQLLEAEVPLGASYDFITVTNPTARKTTYSVSKFLPVFGGTPGLSVSDFKTQTDLQASSKLFDLCICDLDGDGKPEIVTAGSEGNAVDILKNNSTPGTLNFTRSTINLPARTLHVTCGDLNGDGKPELVFTENDGSRLLILANNSTPGNVNLNFQSYSITGSKLKRVMIHDMDDNGKPDIIVTDQSQGKVYVVNNNSAGAVSLNPAFVTLNVTGAASLAGLSIEDMNGDNRPDITVAQFLVDKGGYFVATNNSVQNSFVFSAFQSFPADGTFLNIITSDLNNDNRPDVAATSFLSAAVVAFGNTTNPGNTPSFGGANKINVGARPWGIASGDLDGDGLEDITVGQSQNDIEVTVLHAQDPGSSFNTFGIPVTYINNNIRVNDIDSDGKPDIVFTSVDDPNNAISASKISILLNKKCYQPVVEPAGPFELCNSTTQRLSTQDVPGVNYVWKVNGVQVKSGPDSFIDANTYGDYTVTMEEANGCAETSAAVTVTIKSATSLPDAVISANSPVCVGEDLNLSSNDIGATKYEWSGPAGYTATGRVVTLSNFRNINAGRYYLDVYSGTCLIQTTSIVVIGTPAPDFQVISSDGSTSFCQGQTASLEVRPLTGSFTYQWYDQNGIISGATLSTYDASNTGNYYVKVKDLVSSCPEITTEKLSIEFVSPPTADFDAPTTACASSEVQFTDASTVTGTAKYSWDFGDSKTSTEKSPKHIFTSLGVYDVTLTVNYGTNVCEDQITKQIEVTNGLDVQFTDINTTICEGQSVTLSLTDTYDTYLWSTGETTETIDVSEPGTYTVKVKENGGCEGIANISITVNGIPNVTVTASPTLVAPGEQVQLKAEGLTDFAWTPPEILDDASIATPTAILDQTTVFTVSGTTNSGCQASGDVTVNVSGDLIGNYLHPKNFFSPNTNDSVNPVWIIEGIEEYPQCGIEIYDQTGNKLYYATPYTNSWDGTTLSGQVLPDGAYYYIIQCEGNGVVKSGTVTLLRN